AADPDRRSLTLRGISPGEAERQRLKSVKAALELGADVNAINQAGDTALHIAAAKGSDGFVQLIGDNGTRLDFKENRGMTTIDLAEAPIVADTARVRLVRTAELLRKLGAK